MTPEGDLFNYQPSGAELAEKGIKQSHDHVERVEPDWSVRAVRAVRAYARDHFEFMTEDVKPWAYERGLPRPPADGSWGHVMRTAARDGIIRSAGKRPAKSPGQHGKYMTVWRAL